MRLLTLVFGSSAEFLSHSAEKEGHALLFARTKTEAAPGDQFLVEISLPGLPNRALIRASVRELKPPKGMWLDIDSADTSTRAFILGVARGELEVKAVERSHGRFPASLPVTYKTGEDAAAGVRQQSTVVDLSAGGAFVRAESSPVVGTGIDLEIGPLPDDAGSIAVHGHVAWIGVSESEPGFGVEFEMPHGEEGRKLRTLLRHASETGKVDFVE
jgi:Tfp pilus assembly protein PilZ